MSGASLAAAYRLLIGVSIAAAAGLLIAAIWRLRRNISLAIGLPLLILIVFSNASDLLTRAIGTPSLLQPLIAILAVAVWLRRKRLQPSQRVFTLLTLLLALYCLLIFASTTWAKDLALADERVSDIVKNFAIYLLVAMLIASWSSLRQGIAAVVVTVSALAMLSLVQVATGQYENDFAGFAAVESGNIYSDVSGARISGPTHDPNFYAQLLLIALPFAATGAIAARDALRRTLFTIAFLITGAAVILTYSRGAMLALAVMTVLLLAALRVRVMHFAIAAAAAVLLIFALPSKKSCPAATPASNATPPSTSAGSSSAPHGTCSPTSRSSASASPTSARVSITTRRSRARRRRNTTTRANRNFRTRSTCRSPPKPASSDSRSSAPRWSQHSFHSVARIARSKRAAAPISPRSPPESASRFAAIC